MGRNTNAVYVSSDQRSGRLPSLYQDHLHQHLRHANTLSSGVDSNQETNFINTQGPSSIGSAAMTNPPLLWVKIR